MARNRTHQDQDYDFEYGYYDDVGEDYRYERLSDLDDFELVDDDQDIRGYEVQDTPGHTIGVIDELMVDPASELVEEIILDNGMRIPVSEISIGDDVVYLHDDVEDTVRVYEDTRIRQRRKLD